MKLYKLLEFHFTAVQNGMSLPDSFGDAFLLEHNSFFRRVRSEFLRLGYLLSSSIDHDFLALPFSQLQRIHRERKIPYVKNVNILKQIENKNPRIFDWPELAPGFKGNFIFHESCHVIARSIIERVVSPENQNNILSSFLEESFANATELFSVTQASATAHRIFLSVNSYTVLFEHRARLLSMVDEFGLGACFKFTLLAYLQSHFKSVPFGSHELKDIDNILHGNSNLRSTTKRMQAGELRFLMDMALTMDFDFKTATTPFYLKLEGLSPSRFEDEKKKWLANLGAAPAYLKALAALSVFHN